MHIGRRANLHGKQQSQSGQLATAYDRLILQLELFGHPRHHRQLHRLIGSILDVLELQCIALNGIRDFQGHSGPLQI